MIDRAKTRQQALHVVPDGKSAKTNGQTRLAVRGNGLDHKSSGTADIEVRVDALGIWDAADDKNRFIQPRGWLLGNIFCRQFVSSLFAAGAVGKTAVRYAQLLSLASGQPLTGEHVFQRCRVLIVALEDGQDEVRRRIRAAIMHHDIAYDDLRGWLFLSAAGRDAGKLATVNEHNQVVASQLAAAIRKEDISRGIDVVYLDPFVKAHGVEENANKLIDEVMFILTDMAVELDIAIDSAHHTSKGPPDPGNADRGRGASSMKDAGRLVYTLSAMSEEEAEAFGISKAQRGLFVRMDSGKVNLRPPSAAAKWFRLVGVPLGNATEMYPSGDDVQTVEIWTPPDTWEGLSRHLLNVILDEIEGGLPDGNRYSDAATAGDREAWRVICRHAPQKTDKQAREVIRIWVRNGVLVKKPYNQPQSRKTRQGLHVDNTKRSS